MSDSGIGGTMSFEFFPPRDEKSRYLLEDTIRSLSPFGPDFVSVTDRDAGTRRDSTLDICKKALDSFANVEVYAHLTCHGASQEDMKIILDTLHESGVRGIMALRGDPAEGETSFIPPAKGFRYSGELISFIKKDGRFRIGCAAYPDGHPEAPNRETDWDILIDKFERGADLAVTQCFFDNRSYTEMNDYVKAKRPDAKILPGILPVTNWKSVKRFCERCEAPLPDSLVDLMTPVEDDPIASRRAGIEFTIRQCRELLRNLGAPGIHFYSLNRSTATAEIVTALRMLD